MLNILSDTAKFTLVNEDPLKIIIRKEDKLNGELTELKKQDVIDQYIYSTLHASGSKPGVIYGLPKIHKENTPLRPILSAIGTANYNISKFLVPKLKCLTTNVHTIHDTVSFLNTISNVPNADQYFMASLDVTNLFQNVPLQETSNIILEALFNNDSTVHGINKRQFKNLLDIATKDILFMFNDQTFKQIDGVAMGSPLGPTLANISMSHFEEIWLRECPSEFKPAFYYRY
ncbi:uncharacterized protein LOC122266530, partial [Penaeus japonicus]|uniref:uncharacterized protein LOC122266530 n=1 Tax=Penaeus japonicus TaxID=27405 RepID=UPI001C7143F5